MQRQCIVKMIGSASDWLSNADGALINMADSAGSTVINILPNDVILVFPSSPQKGGVRSHEYVVMCTCTLNG